MAPNADISNALRTSFQRDVDEFFGRNVYVAERAFRHVELSLQLMATHTPDRGELFLSRSIKHYPALLAALDRIGVDRARLRDAPFLTPDQDYLASIAEAPSERILRKSFHQAGSIDAPLVPTAKIVSRTGVLRMEDMLIGPLEARSTGWGLTRSIVRSLLDTVRRADRSLVDTPNEQIYDQIAHELRSISQVDPDASSQQFVLSFDGNRYHFQPFALWGGYSFSESPLPDGSQWVARGNVLQPSGTSAFDLRSVLTLEDLINSDAEEVEFQRFFEQYPEYLLVLGPYTRLHPQLILNEDDGGRLIPDFFLEKINSDFCDICDLKRPTAELIRFQRHRPRFRDAVMEAISQLNFYRDWFEESHNRKAFHDRYGLKAFKPNVVIIIGRRRSYYEEVERIKQESRLEHWIRLSTYDDIVERARQWMQMSRQ